ncbi:hypothetical protein V5O48_010559 [Marasmius crinis-equi]|uniref:Uncharacterized protein n=1 Tax=Marasmius crinis-equi TaxID=585013 RepID=A0ABR3F824_9AGAR
MSQIPPHMQQSLHSQQPFSMAFPPSSNNAHFTFNIQTPMPYFPPNIQPTSMPPPAPASSLPISLASLSPNDLELLRHQLNNLQPDSSTTSRFQANPLPTSQDVTVNNSLARLEAETYADRVYKKWWEQDQFDRKNTDPTWVELPAEPLTTAKVAAYMKWVMSRCKRNHLGEEIPNTTVGKDTIKQTISALKSLRLNSQHLYKNDSEAQRPLQEDSRIQSIERSAVANEATRLNQGEVLKTVGTTADTYITEQLLQAVRWCLSDVRGDQARFKAIRNLVMFILPTASMLQGDNLRRLTFSDISMKDIPNIAKETLDPEGKVHVRRYDIEGLFFLSNEVQRPVPLEDAVGVRCGKGVESGFTRLFKEWSRSSENGDPVLSYTGKGSGYLRDQDSKCTCMSSQGFQEGPALEL